MATVTGKTSEKIDELLNALIDSGSLAPNGNLTLHTKGGTTVSIGSVADSVVSAAINSSGHLILTKRDGSTQDVGAIGRTIDAYPIGAIYISEDPADPTTLFGGTWVRYAKGRVLVGLDEADTTFDTPAEIGGEKTHTLTTNEMPSHGHTASTDVQGNHQHSMWLNWTATTTAGSNYLRVTDLQNRTGGGGSGATIYTDAAGNHGHNITVNANGGGAAHNNLQPFITVYMWKRTA